MEKKLPKVFANNIEKIIENNEKIYVSNKKNEDMQHKKQKDTITNKPKKTINQKIIEILNTKNHIYKIPVKIETEQETMIKKIIGKNQNNLITIDNELIKIEDIVDIEIYEE